ncbi:MAG: signal peptidase I [Leptospiraceae bacterium]|nr:signal peptidase I [Leptospiraceae bacterium]MCB1303233.1 signal peptidase I [Leptospiraceae bacterium]
MPPKEEHPVSVIISFGILLFLVFAFKQSVLDANNIPSGSMIPTLKVGDYLFVNRMRYSFRLPFLGTEVIHIDEPQRGDIITFIPREEPDKNYVKRVIGMPGDRIRIRNLNLCNPEIPVERVANPEYTCDETENLDRYRSPDIAYVEYRPADSGEWKHFTYRELGPEESRAILEDSDSTSVLHPEVVPGIQTDVPVVLEENIEGKKHYIVERYHYMGADIAPSMCPAISTTGCVLEPNRYFVMGDNRDDSKDSRFTGVGPIERSTILGKALIIYFSIDWRDRICHDFDASMAGGIGIHAFKLKDFTVDDQIAHCSPIDRMQDAETLWQYLVRTVLYRIPRMDVRWSRLGQILH